MGKKRFSCSWTNTWQVLHERQSFTTEEEGVLHRLQSYIAFRDNTIINYDTGFPMSKRDIAKLLRKSEKQTGRILDALEIKNAITMRRVGKANAYEMNPCLFWKGTEKDKEYHALYMAYYKEIENIQRPKICPCCVRVGGRVIPIWDIDVLQRGHECPILKKFIGSINQIISGR
ncbi:hypothetical protein [Pelotomaculum propionicicum]|uniref:Uncharacterized protein n=1 Tax=Pelotomaculum propionicicum TaxID=258475 RepID=A0A4Y7RYI9_9FIRM|nr:hypothetical protein [Pelotomaculum propionicicum]TEB13377.1 hypothetical protein Pmgp_00271 [Pelotomaculum propionicicum]